MTWAQTAVTRLTSSQANDIAPPLNRAERITIGAIIAAALVVSVGLLVVDPEAGLASYILDPVLTLTFALFLVSPWGAVALLAVALAASVPLDFAGETLSAFTVAAGLVTRLGTVRLISVYGCVLLLSTAALSWTARIDGAGVGFILLFAVTSGVVGIALRAARGSEHGFQNRLAEREKTIREIQREERLLIADELHDVIAHDLTAIAMQARMMDHQDDPALRVQAQREIGDSARRALSDLRRLIARDGADARPERVVDLCDALESTTRTLETAGYLVDTFTNLSQPLSRLTESALGRILRESATNILKHSAPGPVHIRLIAADGPVELTIRSKILAHRAARGIPSGGYGTARLTERVAVLGGEFSSAPDGDEWHVHATLPVR